MMLLERWAVAAILGFCLVSTAGAPGQSQAPDPAQTDAEPADEPAHYVPGALPPAPGEVPPTASVEPPAPATVAAPTPDAAPAPVRAAPAAPPAPAAVPAAHAHSADPVQRQLENDTLRMLQLVQDLKQEVDKAGSNTLSLAALRKADEIQKLAKSLKERMREPGKP